MTNRKFLLDNQYESYANGRIIYNFINVTFLHSCVNTIYFYNYN